MRSGRGFKGYRVTPNVVLANQCLMVRCDRQVYLQEDSYDIVFARCNKSAVPCKLKLQSFGFPRHSTKTAPDHLFESTRYRVARLSGTQICWLNRNRGENCRDFVTLIPAFSQRHAHCSCFRACLQHALFTLHLVL